VIEHCLEGSARRRVQAARHRAEAGAEEARDVGGHVRDPDIGLFAAPGFGTDLHTLGEIERIVEVCEIGKHELGEISKQRGVERARGERVLDVVLEATDRHLGGALDPGRVEGLGPLCEDQRHERLHLRAGDPPLAPRLSEHRCERAGALETQQSTRLPRRHPEPLARVGVEAPEAELVGAPEVGEGEKERAHPGEQTALERSRTAEPPVELEGPRGLEARHERLDEG
jgi:hypothetical protein